MIALGTYYSYVLRPSFGVYRLLLPKGNAISSGTKDILILSMKTSKIHQV